MVEWRHSTRGFAHICGGAHHGRGLPMAAQPRVPTAFGYGGRRQLGSSDLLLGQGVLVGEKEWPAMNALEPCLAWLLQHMAHGGPAMSALGHARLRSTASHGSRRSVRQV